jgi:hypothetical protein
MSNKRPRGLWKSRNDDRDAPLPGIAADFIEKFDARRDDDENDRPSKKPRRTKTTDEEHNGDVPMAAAEKATVDFDDWEDLKELYDQALERYQGDDSTEALPMLRGVLHECDRFLRFYPDPSILIMRRTANPGDSNPASPSASSSRANSPPFSPPEISGGDLPTAFHAIYGSALFMFGNIIARDTAFAKPGEPSEGSPYYLAALDVFEAGENLPCNTSREPGGEDWRMAISWGRTLVCLADETVTQEEAGRAHPSPGYSSFTAEPVWHRESPFSTQAARQPPVARRMSLIGSSPHDILVMAIDQFSRGMLHMPHRRSHRFPGVLGHCSPSSSESSSSSSSPGAAFPTLRPRLFREQDLPRPKILYTIATEVLAVSERLPSSEQRQTWSQWADGVFAQMQIEAAMVVRNEGEDDEDWESFATSYCRGRCWLIVGSARAEPLESALEKGDTSVLKSELGTEAREALSNSVKHFDRAKAYLLTRPLQATPPEALDGDIQILLAETLITLANLTTDPEEQEALFRRAEVEGGESVHLDDDLSSVNSDVDVALVSDSSP